MHECLSKRRNSVTSIDRRGKNVFATETRDMFVEAPRASSQIRSVRGNAPGSPSHKSKVMENNLKQTFLLLGLLLTLAIPSGMWAQLSAQNRGKGEMLWL
jgi:hypothetical protein